MKKIVSVVSKNPQKAKKPPISKLKAKNKALQSRKKPAKKESRYISRFVGRPLKYKTVEELERLMDKYFLSCWKQKIDMFGNPIFVKDSRGKKTKTKVMVQSEPYTITDLATAIGMNRQMLIEYEKKDEFGDTIKRAKQLCHGYAERQLFIGKNPTGAIFNLKNNYGWRDKVETEHSGNLTWTEEPPK